VSPASTGTGYSTTLTMILEKGALSTFKAVHQHARANWEYVAPCLGVRMSDMLMRAVVWTPSPHGSQVTRGHPWRKLPREGKRSRGVYPVVVCIHTISQCMTSVVRTHFHTHSVCYNCPQTVTLTLFSLRAAYLCNAAALRGYAMPSIVFPRLLRPHYECNASALCHNNTDDHDASKIKRGT